MSASVSGSSPAGFWVGGGPTARVSPRGSGFRRGSRGRNGRVSARRAARGCGRGSRRAVPRRGGSRRSIPRAWRISRPAHGSGARRLCGHVGGMRTPRIPSQGRQPGAARPRRADRRRSWRRRWPRRSTPISRVAVTPRRDTVRRPPLDVVDALCGKAGDEGVGPAVAGALCMAAVTRRVRVRPGRGS